MNYLKTGLLALTTFVSTACILTACDDNTPEHHDPVIPDDNNYVGTVVVAGGTAAEFTMENVSVAFALDEEETVGEIDMFKVKFNERMPQMDISIPQVLLDESGSGYALSCERDGIVPIAAGGPSEAHRITELVGSATAEEISFSMVCMGLEVDFSGAKE